MAQSSQDLASKVSIGANESLNVAKQVIGMVVDGVSGVITLNADQIKLAPEFGSAIDTRYVMGLDTVDDRMLILVDIEKLMTSRDMELVESACK